MKRKRTIRNGAALVEVAITLPVLLLLIGIAVDFSRVFYQTVTMNSAVRNGALYEFDPMNSTQSRFTGYVNAAQVDATNLKTAPTYSKTSTLVGDITRVNVKADLNFSLVSGWSKISMQRNRNTTRNLYINKAPLIPDTP